MEKHHKVVHKQHWTFLQSDLAVNNELVASETEPACLSLEASDLQRM